MSVEEREYKVLFSYLRSLHFHYLDAWVIECVNYYKSKNPDISLEILKNEVKQQWLLVNLREIKVPSLPPNLAASEKIILQGNYAVQVESMIDCSESCYSQFQRLLKISNENIKPTEEPVEKPKRCLTFVLSDGVQEVRGMEYQPIKKIRTNDPELLPGFKMIISGPVECRKGMFLLKESNVTICGGEVDTLATSNSLRSILIKKLDLNEADFPVNKTNSNTENENFTNDIENYFKNDQLLASCEQAYKGEAEILLSQNDDLFLSISMDPEAGSQAPQETQNTNTWETEAINSNIKKTTSIEVNMDVNYCINENDFNDLSVDNVFDDIFSILNKKHSLSQEDIDAPVPKKRSFDSGLKTYGYSSKGNSSSQNFMMGSDMDVITIDVNDDDDDDDDDDERSQTQNSVQPKIKKPVQTKLSQFFKNNNLSDSCVSNSIEKTPNVSEKVKQPVIVNSNPFVYLKQILSVKLKKPAIFTIKAIILTLKKKITIENDEFNLKANITDGSSSLDVNFSSEVLEDLFGFSPCEMTYMMKAKETNNAIADRVKEAFSKVQEKLISLNCLMKIKFFPDKTSPLVLSLEEINFQHLIALRERRIKET